MMPLLDVLSALLGADSIEDEIPTLMAADARAGRILKNHGLLYYEPIRDEIHELADPRSPDDPVRAGYYLGLQMGWRAAQRLR
jgi:hypothetical protein